MCQEHLPGFNCDCPTLGESSSVAAGAGEWELGPRERAGVESAFVFRFERSFDKLC